MEQLLAQVFGGFNLKYGLIATALFIPGFASLLQLPVVAQTPRTTSAQTPSIKGGAAEAPPQQRPVAYPDRQKAPQDVLDRGKATYGVSCAFCHGSDAGGGEVGPNLLRSGVVLDDQNGELISPIVHGARVDRGMPRIEITDAQIGDIVAWLHSLHVASRTDTPIVPINILTGDASAGQVFFQKTCASCHSVTGDLKGFATRFPDPKVLQQTWLLPGGGGGRGAGGAVSRPVPGLHVPPLTVTVSLPNGQKVNGELTRIDDFYVGLKESDGTLRGFKREGDIPKVELHDALAPHRQLLHTYTDKNIHDLTAYMVTLK
jgi:cytochrome c oxidase cbb3-type subunit 3